MNNDKHSIQWCTHLKTYTIYSIQMNWDTKRDLFLLLRQLKIYQTLDLFAMVQQCWRMRSLCKKSHLKYGHHIRTGVPFVSSVRQTRSFTSSKSIIDQTTDESIRQTTDQTIRETVQRYSSLRFEDIQSILRAKGHDIHFDKLIEILSPISGGTLPIHFVLYFQLTLLNAPILFQQNSSLITFPALFLLLH